MHVDEQRVGYLSAEKLLFLSPWHPVEMDTSALDGSTWECPNCTAPRSYFPSLARLQGGNGQLMIQCPLCDHLIVVEIVGGERASVIPRYGGPHIDHFLRYLDQRRNAEPH